MDLTRNESLLIGLGGVAAIAASAYQYVKTERFLTVAEKSQGTVTELVYSPGSGDMVGTYSPRFKFKTPDGETWSVLSGTGSTPAGFHVGEDVTVLFDPKNPKDARIDSVGQVWWAPAFFGLVGIVAVGIWVDWLLEL